MIIELFGPPGVGKTTLAGALTARLRDSGHDARPIMSYRPNETATPRDGHNGRQLPGAVVRRVVRPAIEMLLIAMHRSASRSASVAALMQLMPPRRILWRIRMAQYLARLDRHWRDIGRGCQITIVDQGFAQAICSLALFSGRADAGSVARALNAAPKPDILVRLRAPSDVLVARLQDRRRRQSMTERLLELDVKTSLAALPVIDVIDQLEQQGGLTVIQVETTSRNGLADAVQRIESAVVAKLSLLREKAE